MFTGIASPTLETISYRIANESNFIHKLKGMVEARQLENGQPITEEDAVVLKSYLDHALPRSQSSVVGEELPPPGTYEAWIA